MIARIWRGAVRRGDSDAYAEYMQRTGIADYAATQGNRGVWMLMREVGELTEVVMFTLWDSLDAVNGFAGDEYETARFYRKAAETARDASVRELLIQLAEAEDKHEAIAEKLEDKITPTARSAEDETARRMFVLQYVQPGLVGLMDGSVSTLAPLFAAAFATHHTWETFLVGLAASVGAGISMGFAEALSDDGSLTGRGTPWLRGAVCGLMTTVESCIR